MHTLEIECQAYQTPVLATYVREVGVSLLERDEHP
jgi:hypothetical protein